MPVDISGWLKLAKNTLIGVVEGKEVQWEAVSFALALSTGRKQAEVHCTGQLLLVERTEDKGRDVAAVKAGYAIIFAGRGDRKFGRTKARPGTEAEREWLARPQRTIPTILPAELVIAGWEWLERQGHKVEHEDLVNAAFNGKLRGLMAKVAPGYSYKNLRDFYAVACWRNWLKDGVAETSLPERLKEVLGHGPLGDATPSYRKFCLAAGIESRLVKGIGSWLHSWLLGWLGGQYDGIETRWRSAYDSRQTDDRQLQRLRGKEVAGPTTLQPLLRLCPHTSTS